MHFHLSQCSNQRVDPQVRNHRAIHKTDGRPAATSATIAINVLSVAFKTIAQSTPAKATVDPTDKSKSRDARPYNYPYFSTILC